MKPTIKWVNSFNIELQIRKKSFVVPGNTLHAKLKQHENTVRARQGNMEEILDLERELKSENKEAKNLANSSVKETNERVTEKYIELIRYLFESKNKSKYIGYFSEIFIKVLEEEIGKIPKKNTRIYNEYIKGTSEISRPKGSEKCPCNSLWDYFNGEFILWFERKIFNNDEKKNGIILDFKDNLTEIDLNFFDILKISFERYGGEHSVSESLSKQRVIESKVKVLLEDYKRSCQTVDDVKDKIKDIKGRLEELRKKISADDVEENIIIANVGFVIEIEPVKSDEDLQFFSFPIISASKNVHNIYDQFIEDYSYIGHTSDDKNVKRNSLIDQQLAEQIDAKSGFYKLLDYHSERDLYLYMQSPHFFKYVKNELDRWLGSKQLKKIHYIILDMQSSRYMCNRCQEATAFMQDIDGPFLTQMSNYLKREFKNLELISESKLKMIIRVSASIKFKSEKKEAAEHASPKEIKKLLQRHNLILAMDSSTIKLKPVHFESTLSRFKEGLQRYTLFTSSENNDPTKTLVWAYNDVTAPVRIEAATMIQQAWRTYRNKK